MRTVEVIESLRNLGVNIWAEGTKLLLEPGNRVPGDVQEYLHQYKDEVVEHLLTSSPWLCECIWDLPCKRDGQCTRCLTRSLCSECGGCRRCWLERFCKTLTGRPLG